MYLFKLLRAISMNLFLLFS